MLSIHSCYTRQLQLVDKSMNSNLSVINSNGVQHIPIICSNAINGGNSSMHSNALTLISCSSNHIAIEEQKAIGLSVAPILDLKNLEISYRNVVIIMQYPSFSTFSLSVKRGQMFKNIKMFSCCPK